MCRTLFAAGAVIGITAGCCNGKETPIGNNAAPTAQQRTTDANPAGHWEAEPTDLDSARVLTEFVPLSKTIAEQITALRTWAKGRARFATSPVEEKKLRKLAA